jgi:glycosyltransferase involved in cell wall biosynthesis
LPHSVHKVLIFGLYSLGSGLTRVIEQLAGTLGGGFAIDYVGFVPQGSPRGGASAPERFTLHLHMCRGHAFALSRANLHGYMTRLAPDVAFVMGPVFLTDGLLHALQPYRPRTRIVLYLPIEGELTDAAALNTLALADACILYTESARENVRALCARNPEQSRALAIPPLHVLGHGVDCDVFRPLGGSLETRLTGASRTEARRRLFPGNEALQESFLVLNANRAYHRKRLDLTIAGFAAFATRAPDAVLYLHVPAMSEHDRNGLEQAIELAGIGGRVMLNSLNADGGMLAPDALNTLYNTCDVGLTTAMGEGWGLGTFEHAATGAPQVVPDHTSFAENWSGAAVMMPVSGRQFIFYEFADMFEVSPQAVADALEKLHADEAYRGQMAAAAYARATAPRYRWPEIGGQLASLLNEIAAAGEPRPAEPAAIGGA